MSIKGGPYQRFRRALETENPLLIRSAAVELPRLSLADALRVTLVLQRRDPPRGERAAVRWLARLALEVRGLTVAELQIAAGALAALGPGRRQSGGEALAALAQAHGLFEVERALEPRG